MNSDGIILKIIWAATVNANDPDEIKGVSYSSDGGNTWNTTLLGEWAHNIAVKDSVILFMLRRIMDYSDLLILEKVG